MVMITLAPEQTAALAKLDARTHVLVPVEPTGAMLEAAVDQRTVTSLDGTDTDLTEEFAWDFYRAMITAAQEGET